jgi:hypothetical protein
MTATNDPRGLLTQAAAAIKANQRQQAHDLVKQAIQLNPDNADAWFIASYLAQTVEERIAALELALRLNPQHDLAQQAFAQAQPTTTLFADLRSPEWSPDVSSLLPTSYPSALHPQHTLPPSSAQAVTGASRADPSAPPADVKPTWLDQLRALDRRVTIGIGSVLGLALVVVLVVLAGRNVPGGTSPGAGSGAQGTPAAQLITATRPPTETATSTATRLPTRTLAPTWTPMPTFTPRPKPGDITEAFSVLLTGGFVSMGFNEVLDRVVFTTESAEGVGWDVRVFDQTRRNVTSLLYAQDFSALVLHPRSQEAIGVGDRQLVVFDLKTTRIKRIIRRLRGDTVERHYLLSDNGWLYAIPFNNSASQPDVVLVYNTDTGGELASEYADLFSPAICRWYTPQGMISRRMIYCYDLEAQPGSSPLAYFRVNSDDISPLLRDVTDLPEGRLEDRAMAFQMWVLDGNDSLMTDAGDVIKINSAADLPNEWVMRLDLPAKITALAHHARRGLTVIACEGERQLYVFDNQTFTLLNTLPLPTVEGLGAEALPVGLYFNREGTNFYAALGRADGTHSDLAAIHAMPSARLTVVRASN